MPTYKGVATIFGINGTATVGGAALALDSQSLNMSEEGKVEEFMSGTGEIVGLAIRDVRRKITIDFFPKSTTIDLANAALALPAIPSKVTLAGFPAKATADTVGINTDWLYTGGGSVSVSEGQAKLTLPLWRSVTGASVDTLTTAIV